MNPPDEHCNQRTGKIARLDFALRNVINGMIRDGRTAAEIIAFATQQGGPDLNEQNVTNWRQGGYQDWLKQQARLEDMQAKRDFALRIVSENEGSKIHEAGLNLAASQIFELLQDFDPTEMKELLAKDPENYSRIIGALAKISKEALNFEKYRDAVTKAKAEIQKLRDPKSSLGEDERKAIVDKVDEILGLK